MFFASPLSRARQTMEFLRAAMRLPPKRYRLEPALMELSFGRWEGLIWAEVKTRDPAGAAKRRAEKWSFVAAGGESYAMLAGRVKAWLAGLDGDALVVSHGGVARALMVLWPARPRKWRLRRGSRRASRSSSRPESSSGSAMRQP